MPFADKFRAMLDMPLPGDTLDGFVVQSVDVGHENRAPGHYAYPVRVVLAGPGGLAAVKRAIRPLFARRCTTFSGFGTPYQLWLNKPAVEPLGDGRYAVTAEGTGVRVHLEPDLLRFIAHLHLQGALSGPDAGHAAAAGHAAVDDHAALIDAYLAEYQAEVARVVGRYKTRVRRAERQAAERQAAAAGTG